jgi:uncharacterized protein YPO0396
MTEPTLLSLPDPDAQPDAAPSPLDDVAPPEPGFRLHRVEVLNWGTFDRHVATFHLDGGSALLTGANGSGKSTIADALTALLAPPRKVAFNRSGGDEKQRSLLTYVRGYYTKVTNEETGAVQPVALRPKDDFYSVILAVFANAVTGATATAAQVLWPPRSGTGQPDRFYVTADKDLSIVGDFTDFGSEINALRRRLRAGGATVADTYPAYAVALRKFVSIPSEQAQDLFAQAVSVKGVSDLNAFMRQHMLEETDNSERIEEIVTHFDDLNSAHESITKATDQIERLAPLLADACTYEGHVHRAAELVTLTAALPAFIASGKTEALTNRIDADEATHAELTAAVAELEDQAKDVGEQLRAAEQTRDGLGGTRLKEIERDLDVLDTERDARQARAGRHAEHLATLGRPAVTDHREFSALAAALPGIQTELETQRKAAVEHRDELVTRKSAIRQESAELTEEITSLQQRRTNIPRTSLALRDRLAAAVGTDPDDLPFSGELIQVLGDSAAWEGAAERVLHSFALSMLVPQIHYPAVSEWVNANHLGARLVYHRIPASTIKRLKPELSDRALFHHLEVKDGPFTDWLTDELRTRADHVCADTMDTFRSAERAVTQAGQIKHGRGRHEKDDRRKVGDRSTYVLGWSNEAKIAALVERAKGIYAQQAAIDTDLTAANTTLTDLDTKLRATSTLVETTSWRELDWASTVAKITKLTDERNRILAGSTQMAKVTALIESCQKTLAELAEQRSVKDRELGRLDERIDASYAQLGAAEELLERTKLDEDAVPGLTALVDGGLPTGPEEWDALLRTLTERLSEEQRLVGGRISDWRVTMTKKMSAFRNAYPEDTIELDDSTDAIEAWRNLYAKLTEDDLPRFQSTFKHYLNQGSIREIAGLWAALKAQKDAIEAGLALVNESLRTVSYNPGSYIELASASSPNTEVREFQAMLRACLEGSVGDNAYSEERFAQVKRVIDRFAGREGTADADKAWTRRVTDVRNWCVFRATERSVDDDSELESYDGSGGKSGGQTEKLAYTILGAALAWQYRLGTSEGRRRNFCFVLIDEAFQNVADDNARAALDLFAALRLQLLVVTPLTGVALIEPYVSAVGLASNTARFDNSAIRTLTIEEYRAERDSRLAKARQAVPA